MEKKIGAYTVAITNPDKILFPPKITKLEFVEYYERIAPIMLPHMKGHPITMHRFPQGVGHEGFYHKDIPDYFPSWIDRVSVRNETDKGQTTYAIANKAATLVYLANYGCITPHIWLSRTPKLDFPDTMVFDLDPGKQDFKFVCKVALQLKKMLEAVGLVPFVKTSGSKGLHVAVPLDRSKNFDYVRAVARVFAQQIVAANPEQATLEVRINQRKGKLFVDIARNAFGQTVAAPYSVRALIGAPVATPIAWSELGRLKTSQAYTIHTIFRRLSRKQDPWKDMYQYAKKLPKI